MNTSYCRHKGHVARNNLLDVDTKSLGPNSSESELDKDKVIKVVAHS
jgi:hypothetical protein